MAVRGERILAAALAAAGRRRFRNRIAGQAARYWSEPTGSAWEANSHWRSGIGDQAWLEVGVDHWKIYETFARALNSPSPNTVMEWGAGGGANAVAFAPMRSGSSPPTSPKKTSTNASDKSARRARHPSRHGASTLPAPNKPPSDWRAAAMSSCVYT